MPGRHLTILILVILSLDALGQPSRPLPLDPLTPAEVASAQQIVTRDQRVSAIAGESPRVIVVQFIAPKSQERNAEPSGRFAEVVVHDDRQGGGARVLVNLGTSSVVDVVRLTERNVPIGPSDIELAASLALENNAVQRVLGGPEVARSFRVARRAATRETMNDNSIEGVSDRGIDPDDPCTTHRCVTLFFRTRGRYVAINQVTVDLTDRRVLVREQGVRP